MKGGSIYKGFAENLNASATAPFRLIWEGLKVELVGFLDVLGGL
jgi:hypothetical protein